MTAETVIELKQATKSYGKGETLVHALDHMDLVIRRGEFSAVVGPSGSGKSTFLHLVSGLDTPTSGEVFLAGRSLKGMKPNELSDFRRDHIGFIFQSYNLIPVLTVSENVEYVLQLKGVPAAERKVRVSAMLKEVGLEGKEDRYPNQLSGGQQQRVAIARAVVSEPDLILADEPTANLDSVNGGALLDMMRRLNESRGTTFLFSTHDKMIMERARRLVVLRDGRVVADETRPE